MTATLKLKMVQKMKTSSKMKIIFFVGEVTLQKVIENSSGIFHCALFFLL